MLSGTYLFDKTPYTSPDGVNDVLLTTKSSRQIAALEETHIFKPTFANSVRFGYNYEVVDNNQGASALVPEAADTVTWNFPWQDRAAGIHRCFNSVPGWCWRRVSLLLPLEHLSGL